MAVRRLASDDVQPDSFSFTPKTKAWTKELVAKYPEGREASAVIPLLWRVQGDCGGWLPRKALEAVADRLAMPYIRVFEVATFYTMFNLEPVGKFYIQMCGTTPCMLCGSNEIRKVLEERIGPANHVTADGMFSWIEVECLGACCNAPMVQINDDYYEDLTPESFNKLLDDLAAGRPVKTGPQSERRTSEPEGDVKTLTDPALFDGSVVGSWRKRFEEAAARAALKNEEAPEPAPATLKPAKPDAGRAVVRPVADAPAQKAAELEAEEKEVAAKLAALPKTATPEEKANAIGARPEGLKKPRGGKADDLKKIDGVGPANEAKLNALGVYHYDQIADWDRAQILWVGAFLSFAGRIDREGWVAQARELASKNKS
ncbi:MAG: NADH-quinone oxidoreductase subunit NuoE [Salinarimonadaceae bacterium]|nr:MAG: NADH-quinone oxidoreductase subunit NuoE [Salinarimonadaceae bacterium]